MVSLADFLVVSADAVVDVAHQNVLASDSIRSALDLRAMFKYGRSTSTSCFSSNGNTLCGADSTAFDFMNFWRKRPQFCGNAADNGCGSARNPAGCASADVFSFADSETTWLIVPRSRRFQISGEMLVAAQMDALTFPTETTLASMCACSRARSGFRSRTPMRAIAPRRRWPTLWTSLLKPSLASRARMSLPVIRFDRRWTGDRSSSMAGPPPRVAFLRMVFRPTPRRAALTSSVSLSPAWG